MGPPKGELPPYDYHVWFKGKKKPEWIPGFSEAHVRMMCEEKGRKPSKIKRFKKKEIMEVWEPLGPKGAQVNRPADYDEGFKLLKDWVDSIGGPPEDLRMKLRELWIDYPKVKKK